MLFDTYSCYEKRVEQRVLKVVQSVNHINHVKPALKYIDLARPIIKDNDWCNDLSNHLKSKYGLEG